MVKSETDRTTWQTDWESVCDKTYNWTLANCESEENTGINIDSKGATVAMLGVTSVALCIASFPFAESEFVC